MTSQTIGDPVHLFTLPDLDGERRPLAEWLDRYRGIVVVFWSGICSHCQRYDAYLNSFKRSHDELGLVAIASRQNETAADLRRIVAERRLEFSILHDAERQVAREWQVEQTPRVFLVDNAGRLLYRGAIDNFKYPRDPGYEAHLEPAIDDFLAGRPVRRSETPSFGCAIESVYYQLPKA